MPETTDKGGRKPRVTDDELLAVFHASDDPVLSTREVTDEVPIKRRGTLNRLQGLAEDGKLESKQIGSRNTVWWLADLWSSGEGGTDQEPRDGRESVASDVEREPSTTETPAWEREIEAIETPGNETQKAKREDALREAYRHLMLNETAQKADFEELLGDDVGYASFDSWWTNYVKAKDALKRLPNVTAPSEGGHTWHYVTEDA